MKYHSETPTFLECETFIAIPPNKQEWYFNELEKLSARYKVKEEHVEHFAYILGQHFFNYQTVE